MESGNGPSPGGAGQRGGRRAEIEARQIGIGTSVACAGVVKTPMPLAALSPNFVLGQKVKRNDARLRTQMITVPSPGWSGQIRGYLARPAAVDDSRLPMVLVIHENREMNPQIEDITRRARAGCLHGLRARCAHALGRLRGR